ncbi:MAG: ATP synthase F0 subunit C [bacterium]
MEKAVIKLAAAIAIALPAMIAALAQGIATGKAVESIARQPEAKGPINQALIVGLAFMESLVLYGLLIAIILIFT